MDIDWQDLARNVGAISQTSTGASRGHAGAVETRAALAALLGVDVVRSAVRHAVSLNPGCGLAASVVAQVRGRVAMDECLRLYRELENDELRLNAVRVLYNAADATVLPVLKEFLMESNSGLHRVVAWVAYKLAMASLLEPEDALEILEPLARSPDQDVRTQADELLPPVRALLEGQEKI